MPLARRIPAVLAGAAIAVLVPLSAAARPPDASSLARYIDVLAPARRAPRVTVDVSAAPAAQAWADVARTVAAEWFPHICQLLATRDYRPPKEMRLVFKPDIGAPAYASGDQITIDAGWIARHPEDFGMVIHEMTHLIQHYPGGGDKPGWLVEGIADYVRWWRYEPEAPRTPVDPGRAKVTDSYRTTAAFLAWAVAHYDRSLVRKLDAALRVGKYEPGLWEQSTGKTLDALWSEYAAGLRRAPG